MARLRVPGRHHTLLSRFNCEMVYSMSKHRYCGCGTGKKKNPFSLCGSKQAEHAGLFLLTAGECAAFTNEIRSDLVSDLECL